MAVALNIHQTSRAVPSTIAAIKNFRENEMKTVNRITRIAAAASALSVTFALVWGMANLGYPGSGDASIAPMAAAPTTTHYR